MSAFIRWYIAVQVLAGLAFLLAGPCLRRLPDAGYAISKTLGVLFLGFLLWIGCTLGLVRNDFGGAALVVVLLAAAAAWRVWLAPVSAGSWRQGLPDARAVALTELLFLTAFAGWCLVRLADPAANHTEQPMDLMLLTAISGSPTFPPQDPWLAGYPVGYYYLGYWLLASLGHLTGLPASIAYNVGQACWFGLLIVTVFGVGGAVASRSSSRGSAAAGLIAAVSVGAASNLHLATEWLGRWWRGDPWSLFTEHWWWWRSTRLIQDVSLTGDPIEVIAEFPIFSYVLGDNHPHVLSMPFVALTIALAFNLYLATTSHRAGSSAGAGRGHPQPSERGADAALGLAVFACAALVPLNTWDVPAAFALVVCAAAAPALGAKRLDPASVRRWVRISVVALLALTAVNVPFFLTAHPRIQGVLPNLFHPTPAADFAIAFGTLAPGVLLLLRAGLANRAPGLPRVARDVLGGVLASAAVLAAGAWWAGSTAGGAAWLARVAGGAADPLAQSAGRWAVGWPVLLLIVAGLVLTAAALAAHLREARPEAEGRTFALLLALIGLGLVLVPELVYAHDVFASRMNTVFKFYYQAWLFLGIAGAAGIAFAWRRGGAPRLQAALALVVLCAGLAYAPAAVRARTQAARASSGTLDALDFVRAEAPEAFAAIEWVRAHTRHGALVVQAPGRSYHAGDNLISTATARPTLLGWEGHERQWRGGAFDRMADGRLDALRRIYTPESERALAEVLCAWGVDYVYLGPVERARYAIGPDHEARLERTLQIVFERGSVRLYGSRGCV